MLGTAWRTQSVLRPAPDRIEIELRGAMDHAWVFVSESFDQGWKARVDAEPGREAALFVAEGDFMALPVRQGDRRIRLVYEPPQAKTGFFVALLGFLALLWAWKPRFGR
jgi:uncharacterized membrane protein YfhO